MKKNFTSEALEVLFDKDYIRFNEMRAKEEADFGNESAFSLYGSQGVLSSV
jgi:hypothetical protein